MQRFSPIDPALLRPCILLFCASAAFGQQGNPVEQAADAADAAFTLGSLRLRAGFVEFGLRAVDEGDRAFRTYEKLEPGAYLRRAEALFEAPPDAVGLDRMQLQLEGLGDPRSSASVELLDTNHWRLKIFGEQSEDLFDPSTELHDLYTRRATAGLEWSVLESGLRLGFEHGWREEDSLLTRYRDTSFERFEDVEGQYDQETNLLWLDTGWKSGDWSFKVRPALRWMDEDDKRQLFAPNTPIADTEDASASSQTITPSIDIFAEGEYGESTLVDVQLFGSYSRRDLASQAEASGIDAGSATYAESRSSDGRASGDYLRLEAGLLTDLSDAFDASLRVRYRRRSDDSSVTFSEAFELPPGSPPVTTTSIVKTSAVEETLDLETSFLTSLSADTDVEFGYSVRFEDLETSGTSAEDGNDTTHGIYLRARTEICDDISLRGRLRAFAADDPYTRIAPDSGERLSLDADWQACPGTLVNAGVSTSQTSLAAGGSESDSLGAHLNVHWDPAGDQPSAFIGLTIQDYDTQVDSIAQVSGFPVPYTARFEGTAVGWVAASDWQWAPRWKLAADLMLTEIDGDNASRLGRGRLAVEREVREDFTMGLSFTRYDFNGAEADADDFRTSVFELSLRFEF